MHNYPEPNKIILFQDRKIRRIWHDNEWFYSVVDVIAALSEEAITQSAF